jgi:DnaK suppressor protein
MGLSKDKLVKFKELFLIEHAKILKNSLSRASDEADVGGDEADIVSLGQMKALSDSLSSRDKISLIKIENSLMKIAQGTFGHCEECEEEISEARLKAIPDCSFCISCAEQMELNKKRGLI